VTWGKFSKSEAQRVTRVGQEEFQPNQERVRGVPRYRREFQKKGKRSSKGIGNGRESE
jgi:hypothetical protein